jgi:hypothetical protein
MVLSQSELACKHGWLSVSESLADGLCIAYDQPAVPAAVQGMQGKG